MVTGLHLTSYLAPGAGATAAGVHTVIAYGVLVKQQGREVRKLKRSSAALRYFLTSVVRLTFRRYIFLTPCFTLHTHYY